ncbi:hypothetical protein FHG87_013334 [Trinorchestia longiramus]|nr:hypothetical protein FHG87_013334 [Trinorchestia longiramus]
MPNITLRVATTASRLEVHDQSLSEKETNEQISADGLKITMAEGNDFCAALSLATSQLNVTREAAENLFEGGYLLVKLCCELCCGGSYCGGVAVQVLRGDLVLHSYCGPAILLLFCIPSLYTLLCVSVLSAI